MRVAHDIRLFTVTSIHRKPVEAHETARNLRQVRQKMTEEEDPRVKQERNQAGKIWGKEKVLKEETDWCSMHVKVIPTVDEEHVSSENESTFCWSAITMK